MFQIYGYLAQDIARERRREAEAVALARLAAELDAEERRAHPSIRRGPRRPAEATRHSVAVALRGVSGIAEYVSRSACSAAARLDRLAR